MMASSKSSRIEISAAKNFEPGSIFTIRVGTLPEQKDFIVHEGIICARSEFFSRTMNGNWPTSRNRIVTLNDDDPDMFAIYLNHVYTNRLATIERASEAVPMTRAQIINEYMRLSKLYVLCERFLDREAKNAVMVALLELFEETDLEGMALAAPSEAIALVYEETPHDSPIQRLFIDITATLADKWLAKGRESKLLPKEFWCDLAIALRKGYGDEVDFRKTADAYLEKPEEEGSAGLFGSLTKGAGAK